MTEFGFSKIRDDLVQPLLVMFESGKFRKPLAILGVRDLITAVREYGEAAFLMELRKFDSESKRQRELVGNMRLTEIPTGGGARRLVAH